MNAPGVFRRWHVGRRLVSAAWLLGMWVAVSGSYTPGSIFGGLVAVAAVTLLFRRPDSAEPEHRVRPLMLIRYLGHFLYELVLANIEVARAVIQPKRVLHTRGILEIPLPRSSKLVGAVLANAVSLTPGTSIIEVAEDPPSFHVHVLHLESIAETRSSIAELHWRLVRALGPAECLAEVEAVASGLREQVAAERAAKRSDGQAASGDRAESGRQPGRDRGAEPGGQR
ncbi:MAG TPA: Na+/H+ antiporter subunit E [Microthrixaceae bacterium]|nr:Na+/H+ antiporter subunit E [Microthrixaceae bacterium]